jgi:polar amino acid transport system substrate-binding protein/glutamate/aspartate transport system substrate-binding protein
MRFIILAVATCLASTGVQAQTIDRILERNELRLGYRVDAPPVSYQTTEGNPDGYAPQLCVHVAQGLVNSLKADNMDVQFVPVDASNRFEKVANGEIDLLCGAATITLPRRAIVDFSIPIYIDGTSVLLPANAEQDLRALANKTVGVRRDTTTETTLSTTLENVEANDDVQIERFADHESALIALENGDIAAYFADQSILTGLWMSSPKRNDLKLAREIFTIEKQGLALARGDSDFRLLVDGVLSSLYANGKLRETLESTIPGLEAGQGLNAMFIIAPVIR